MYNLDTVGLILLFGALIIGGGLYLVVNRNKKNEHQLLSPANRDDGFETAEELFPVVEFPPEPEQEHVPELPWRYGDNDITLMARDPEWIFTYWDVNDDKRNSLRQTYGQKWDNSIPVLRVYDVTSVEHFNGTNANSFYDTVINDYAGNWYLNVGVPDRTYCVDLGRMLSDGRFIVVARSNFTPTPRNCISDRTDSEWMLVSENERKLYARIGLKDRMSSADLFKH